MSTNVAKLLDELPDDLDQESVSSAQQELQGLLSTLSTKPVPVGRLSRMWILGSLKAKIAMAYFVHWVRSGYTTSDERERQANETHLKAALKLLGGMGHMRGAIMKVGQTLANYPSMAPKEIADTLGKLHFEAPPMHYSLVREHLRRELGANPEQVFAEFETEAFAAASLGQVHRARLKSGEVVAVKVQYPNIAKTVETDYKNFIALMMPMRLSRQWHSLRRQWEDVRDMFILEADYEREARLMGQARSVFTAADRIVVPEVFPELSTKRVLTMTYLSGCHIDDYLAKNPSQDERDRYGEMLMRASFRVAHAAKIWYSDSHPGNYIFMDDGQLGVIDFGCCREFSEQEWAYYREVSNAFIIRDPGRLRKALIWAADIDEQSADQAHIDYLDELSDWFSGYFRVEGKFDFGDEAFMQRGVDLFADSFKKGYLTSLPVNTWINRHLLGLRALAHKLRARIDMKALNEQESQDILEQ